MQWLQTVKSTEDDSVILPLISVNKDGNKGKNIHMSAAFLYLVIAFGATEKRGRKKSKFQWQTAQI